MQLFAKILYTISTRHLTRERRDDILYITPVPKVFYDVVLGTFIEF